MKIYTLRREQFLPVTLAEAWAFFATPANLDRITPDFMKFRITSAAVEKMYPGQIITYKIGLLPGITQGWVTEITHVREQQFFVDEQRFGPYRFWHHQHHFEPVDGGVRMVDEIHYAAPFGILGRLVHALYIRRTLEKIFSFRFACLEEQFGTKMNRKNVSSPVLTEE
jgi:ligand-binding SRPBCC domain-containing protein